MGEDRQDRPKISGLSLSPGVTLGMDVSQNLGYEMQVQESRDRISVGSLRSEV